MWHGYFGSVCKSSLGKWYNVAFSTRAQAIWMLCGGELLGMEARRRAYLFIDRSTLGHSKLHTKLIQR